MSDLILLHGFTGGPSSFEALVACLPQPRPRIHCPPVLGHCGAAEARSVSFPDELARLEKWIGERVPTGARAHVCGYSLGGRLALGLLARQPQRFAGALLVGVHPGLVSPAERGRRRQHDARWAELLEREGTEAFARAWEAQPLFRSQRAADPILLEKQRRLRRSHPALGLARALRVLGLAEMPDTRRHLSDLGPAVQLVVGGQDPKFCALAHEMVASAPNLRLACVPGVGHNVVLEAPGPLARLVNASMGAGA